MSQRTAPLLLLLLLALAGAARPAVARAQENAPHTIAPGDSWLSLAWAAGMTPLDLLRAQRILNPGRMPAIGTTLPLPAADRAGSLLRPSSGGLLAVAAAHGRSPWGMTDGAAVASPYRPAFGAPLFLPGGDQPPRDLPPNFRALALNPVPAKPGQALAMRATYDGAELPAIALESLPWAAARRAGELVALGGTGSFFPPGQHLLTVITEQGLWEQPLHFAPGEWTYEQVNFTGTAVFNAEEIRLERERLQAIWDQVTPRPLWQGEWIAPIEDYVEITSLYGARRSVNGGPYSTYHEGTDFSAYGGTPVLAPAAGRVVLAEPLNVRGGAVVLDHGLGLHSGYYHLSALHVQPGTWVAQGDLVGEVGSTGRSTGNHLHWDLLVGRIWVDPQAWLAEEIASQVSAPWPPRVPIPARQEPRP